MSTQEKIVEKLRTNRISTVEVTDVMGKTGAIPEVKPANQGHYQAGPVRFVYAYDESNWPVHEQIEDVEEGEVVVIQAIGCGRRACVGDIMLKYMLLYRKASAVVVNGYVRDMHRVHKEDYPVWCIGGSPVGCFNRELDEDPESSVLREFKDRYEDSIAICDDSGVCIVPPERQNDDLIEGLDFIELQEDIWYYCVDTLKLSTFETVCEKQYLENPNIVPASMRNKLAESLDRFDAPSDSNE